MFPCKRDPKKGTLTPSLPNTLHYHPTTTSKPSSFTPPPPWDQLTNNTRARQATNEVTLSNPSKGWTSTGDPYFSLIWHGSGALIANLTNKLLPLFWDILFWYNLYIFSSKASFREEKCRTFAVQSVSASQVCCRVFLCMCVGSQTKQGCWNAAGTADFCWLADSAVPVPSPDGGND